MKRALLLLAVYLLVFLSAFARSPQVHAQQLPDVSPAASPQKNGGVLSFQIDILGTSHYSDIAFIQKGLESLPEMIRLVPSRSSAQFYRLSGTFRGSFKTLQSTIEGLSVDRFSVKSLNSEDNHFILHKLPPQ